MIKVVIIEDEELLRKGLIYTFDWQSIGFIVIGEAENGAEGKRLIEQLNPDVVVTDIKMPLMDGLSMLQSIEKRDFETIIMTGFAEFEYAKKAIELSVSHFVLKPIEEEKLLEILMKVKDSVSKQKELMFYRKGIHEEFSVDLFDGKKEVISQNNSNKIVQKTIDFIHEHYHEKISLKHIGKGIDMSSGYISRTFKEVTSFNVNDYINRYRIFKSIELLKEDRYRLYEIAEMVGFREYKYFHHVFTQYMKCSPKEFMVAIENMSSYDQSKRAV